MIIKGENKAFHINGNLYHCALDITMDYIGGKWKCVILWYIKRKKMRFSEIKQLMPDITEKTLSLQLRALERDGILKREVFGKKPPVKVEYSLTEFGKTLLPVINEIAKWGRYHGNENGVIVDI